MRYNLLVIKAFTAVSIFCLCQAFAIQNVEPAWCKPGHFAKLESLRDAENRTHVFKVGELVIAGLPIGNLQIETTVALAEKYSPVDSSDKYCTWFLGDQGTDRDIFFRAHHIEDNHSLNDPWIKDQYFSQLKSSFGSGPESFLYCAEKKHYIGIGCDQMHNRGPTTFAMLLAFAGCTPKHAWKITFDQWGAWSLFPFVRYQLIQKAYGLGNNRPDDRYRLQQVMGEQKGH